ncbi:MAG: hypothetical protein H0Z29_00955 [Candidatus Marinimicrobia bacterium]|nr:hypothetical protein [Candidatus Neomarinimicrobiota bacterium]
MEEEKQKNIDKDRREFLKRMASSSIFVPPVIKSFSLLQISTWWWWTGHHHHHRWRTNEPPPPPPPPTPQ